VSAGLAELVPRRALHGLPRDRTRPNPKRRRRRARRRARPRSSTPLIPTCLAAGVINPSEPAAADRMSQRWREIPSQHMSVRERLAEDRKEDPGRRGHTESLTGSHDDGDVSVDLGHLRRDLPSALPSGSPACRATSPATRTIRVSIALSVGGWGLRRRRGHEPDAHWVRPGPCAGASDLRRRRAYRGGRRTKPAHQILFVARGQSSCWWLGQTRRVGAREGLRASPVRSTSATTWRYWWIGTTCFVCATTSAQCRCATTTLRMRVLLPNGVSRLRSLTPGWIRHRSGIAEAERPRAAPTMARSFRNEV
jgi:hypothetical protein